MVSSSAAIPARGMRIATGRGVSGASHQRGVHSEQNAAMLYSSPSPGTRKTLQFHSFDGTYVESLCAGDGATEEHFVGYFSALLKIKLRPRLRSPQAIEDVCQ